MTHGTSSKSDEDQSDCNFGTSTSGISNATREGSVLSPYLFISCYLDGLLREIKLRCHVGGVWIAALAYADDLALMVSDWLTLERRVAICKEYCKKHNLVFSTDPDPSKSTLVG